MRTAPRFSHVCILSFTASLLICGCQESEKERILRETNERVKAYEKQTELFAQKAREEQAAREAARAEQRLAEQTRAKQAQEAKLREAIEKKERREAELIADERAEEAEKNRKEQEWREKAKKLVEAKLSSLSFHPKIDFSPSLGTGGSAELRGASLSRFQKLFEDKNWLGLLKEGGGTSFDNGTDLPNESSINYAAQRVGQIEFPMVIKPPAGVATSKLSMVSLQTFEAVDVSEPHPDGGAFVVKWSALMGDCIVIKGRIPAASNQLWGSGWASELHDEEKRLQKKKELGELDNAGVASALTAKRSEIRASIQKWAGMAGGADENLLQSAAEAFVAKDWPRVAQLTAQAAALPNADSKIQRAAELMANVVKDIIEMRKIPAIVKASDEDYARLNLEASKPQPEAQREALTKRAIQVRDNAAGLPMKKAELEIKATKAIREVEQLLRGLVSF